MLSQKLQDDLMTAYQRVHEEKRGHAAGDSDVEKQASQLASDVRYKAKGKVKPGASDEEKKKVFIQILGASPAPNAVKAMAKQKLMGEQVEQQEVVTEMSAKETLDKKMKEKKVNTLIKKDAKRDVKTEKELAKAMMGEERFTDGPEGTKKRLKALAKKRKMPMSKMKDHPQFQPEEFAKTGMAKGSGKPGGAMKKFLDAKAKKLQKEYDSQSKEKKNNPAFQSNRLNPKPVYNSYNPLDEMSHSAEKSKTKDKKITPDVLKKIRATNTGAGSQYEEVIHEKKAKKDYDGDGKVESGTQEFLGSRDKAIKKAIAKRRGRVKEGFSAWRIDLDFNESVKK